MASKTRINIDPYSSIVVSSLKEARIILENVLALDFEPQHRKIDKPVTLYGAGELGKMAVDFLNYLSIPFLYAVDKNATKYKEDKFWNNIEVMQPENAPESDKNKNLLVICLVSVPLIDLRDKLRNDGWEDIVFFYDICEAYRDNHPLNNGWFTGKLSENDKKSIRTVFSSLSDDVSKAHYVQFIAWRILRIELLFNNIEINRRNRFFIPEITQILRDNEIFTDCGAHEGTVTEKYLNLVNGNYKSIWAIEPDSFSAQKLKNRLSFVSNINIVEKALSDKNGKEKFKRGFGFASKLSEEGNDNVYVTTLDSLNTGSTFLKMHLEGGEFNALNGAQRTIKEYRPIIAVTLYHNSDGIWKIILFLMNLVGDYNYHFRLHSWAGTSAVLYAIPKERIEVRKAI